FSTICVAPWHSVSPGGSSARIVAAGSKQSDMPAKSRAASASRRRPPTDHRVVVVAVLSVDEDWSTSLMKALYGAAARCRIGCAPYFWTSVDGFAHSDQTMLHREHRGGAAAS